MAWLQQRMAAEALQGRAAFALDLCLDEAGANILMHGYPHLRPGAPASLAPRVRLGFRRRGAIATLELQDNGIPFDPSTYVPRKLPRTLQDAETGGQGIRLMRNYLCDMQYRRQGGWNILSLSVNVD
jgi:anti-sigma regulatory factor (Ser/Thr protein kinase)